MRSKTSTPAKPSSRLPSPNPSSALPPAPRSTSRGPTPDSQLNLKTRRTSSGPAPAPAPGPSPSKTSRFGFFTRRTKTEPTLSAKSDGKLHRRGPAAGTGHEGYGRYAVRGRSGSSISTNSIGRSASAGTTTESLDKTPSTRKSSMTSTTSGEMDDFFLNRLAPVVIRGTGSSTELSRSPEPMQSTSSLDVSVKPALKTSRTDGRLSQSAIEKNQPILLPSAMPDTMRGVSPMKKMTMGLRRPSDSEDDTKKSSLPGEPSSSGSRIAGRTRKNSISEAASDIKEGTWLKSKKNKADKDASKPPKRWNFFQRAHAGPRTDTPAGPAASPSNKTATSRSVAHYALMDQSGLELDDIEQLMKEADEGTESAFSDDEPGRKERMLSMLLPPKPILEPGFVPMARPASPKVFLRSEAPPQPEQQHQQSKLVIDTNVQAPYGPDHYSPTDLTPVTDLSRPSSPFAESFPVQEQDFAPSLNATLPSQTPQPGPEPTYPGSSQEVNVLPQDIPSPGPPPANPPPRPSRLAQVGRIPQVVSTRRQPGRPSSRSFSRPFASNQPRPTALPRTSFDSIGSVVATAGPVEPYPILQGLSALSHGSAIATMSPDEDEANRRSEFFKFPRKDSEVSYSSSSGVWSFAPAASTAVVPSPDAPLSEDELWNEYDDLIDEVLSPESSRTTEQRVSLRSHPSLEPMPLRPKAPINMPGSEQDDDEVTNPSLHLRRSRLLAVLHSNQSPTSSVSFSEFISDYGERKISVIDPVTGRLSLPASPRLSTGSAAKRSTRSSLPASLSQSARQSRGTVASKSSRDRDSAVTNRYRDSRLMDIAESQTDGLLSMANLRFGALMISKWLSFGRVLFSPVHFELKNPNEDRVLVIDGLGKDWSYYCALTYPEATVYDMGPDPSSTSSEGTAEAWSTLGNHRHICHPSLSKAFPFPMHFFACVVLRFPTALPSSEHHFVLSEAKRVLRPGGYLEFSVLDMDLVNMGNRARRAVRGLKMRMQVADENISLRNISDEVMAGIGRKGFVECNRCVVGVPVAGRLPGLDDTKATSTVRKDSTTSSTAKAANTAAPPSQPKPGFSFSELLNATSASESTNNDITDMVARVGRWWYSRCYESLVLPEAGEPGAATSGTMLETSIWRDQSLIQECEKRGTSFKLLIGYAQKPEMGVRRTVSV